MDKNNDPTPAPTAIYSDGEYLQNNAQWHAEDSPYKASVVISAIERSQVRFAACADIGCGAGLVTELLATNFPERKFVGYELSADAQQFWKQRRQLPNLRLSCDDLLASDSDYDLIVCLDVFEHIEDHFGFLRALRKRGRQFVFNIPLDMNIVKLATGGIRHAREEVGHLHYFNQYSAIHTLQDCGYRIIDQHLSVAFLANPPRNLRQWAVLPLRLLSLVFGKRFASRVFGGISLVVTAAT